MADQSLQAFQLGASLFDRAQTQARIMEQLQMQAADQVMRQRQADLQNKIQSNAYAQALDEQSKLIEDYDNMQKNLQMRDEFFRNPSSDFPTFLPVKAKSNQNAMFQISQQLDDYAPRARFFKAMKQIDNDALDEASKIARTFNVKPINPDGSLNQDIINEYRPKLIEKEEVGKLSPEVRAIYFTQPKEMSHVEKIAKANEIIANKPTAQQKVLSAKKESAIKDAENIYGPLSPHEKDAINATVESTGWKPLTGVQLNNFEGNRLIAENADRLLDRIKNLEKTNPGELSKHTGWFNKNIDEISTKIAETKNPAELEALSIIQDFQKGFNLNALLGSGKTITPSEFPRLEKEYSSIQNKNFAHNFENYAKSRMRDLYSVASEQKTLARIPENAIGQIDLYNSKYKLGFKPIGRGAGVQSAQLPSIDTATLDAELEKRGLKPNR